jgi:uncharacterized membrane protein YphA (DoxX/SURF4 family)
MRIAVIIVRTLMGLMFVFASSVYFFHLMKPTTLPTGDAKIFNDGIAASGYLMQVVKAFEFVCGLALLAGLYTPLAAVVIFPITLNILLYHAFLGPEGLAIAVPMFVGNVFLLYAKRHYYAPLFTR